MKKDRRPPWGACTGISFKMNMPALAAEEQALRRLRLVCEPIFKTQSVLSGSIPTESHYEKRQAPTLGCLSFFMVTRTGIEPMLQP